VKPGLLKAWQLVTCSVQYWVADNASTTGAALAFYCPGKIIGDPAANQQVAWHGS